MQIYCVVRYIEFEGYAALEAAFYDRDEADRYAEELQRQHSEVTYEVLPVELKDDQKKEN